MTEIDNEFKIILYSRHRKLNFTVIIDGNRMDFCSPIVLEWMMAEKSSNELWSIVWLLKLWLKSLLRVN